MGHKAVINSKMYDTSTAQYIGAASNYWHASNRSILYRKKTGEFFIYNQLGGFLPDSMKALMAKQKNSIIPLTEEEAKALVEEWCSADTYIQLFGEVDE